MKINDLACPYSQSKEDPKYAADQHKDCNEESVDEVTT